ncbi:MAG: tetratricopeptide repeat protein [Candidatus Omnitrophica bacterium]|nr:tetratricopeptide repeat protein [Candidatus Omnitrophota bacterium]
MSKGPAEYSPLFLILICGFVFYIFPFCAQAQVNREAQDYRQQGLEAQEEGNIEEALACYQKAIIIDSNFPEAYNDIGIILEAKGQLEQAKYMYLKAVEIAPDYPYSYTNLALLFEAQKDYVQAIPNWVKRASLGTDVHDYWAELARSRLEEIARIYPEAYSSIGAQYQKNIAAMQISDEEFYEAEEKTLEDYQEPREIISTAFYEPVPPQEEELYERNDNTEKALEYLARAKDNFSKGEYVVALREATVAEYLDSSSSEIREFVDNIRKTILQ